MGRERSRWNLFVAAQVREMGVKRAGEDPVLLQKTEGSSFLRSFGSNPAGREIKGDHRILPLPFLLCCVQLAILVLLTQLSTLHLHAFAWPSLPEILPTSKWLIGRVCNYFRLEESDFFFGKFEEGWIDLRRSREMRVTQDMIIDVTLDNFVMYGNCDGDRKKIILRKKNIYLFDK